MDKNELELQLNQLDGLQHVCNQIIAMESTNQSDTALTKLLTKEYSLSKEDKDSILSIVSGKKNGKPVSQKDLDTLKRKFESYCVITDVNPNDKTGHFLGYKKIKMRLSNKKNILKKKIEAL